MVQDKGKLPKKRFGEKYTRQPAPEHSSSDEGINPYLPPQADKKTMQKAQRDAPSTSHSSSAIKGSNDKSKHGIHYSLDLKLKCKVKASNIHGIPLVTDNKIVVRHRLYNPTLNSATFQPTIRQPFSIFRNVTTTLAHDRETFGSQFRNC